MPTYLELSPPLVVSTRTPITYINSQSVLKTEQKGRNKLNCISRRICLTLTKAIVICALTLTILGAASTAFGFGESTAAKVPKRLSASLTYTTFQCPNAPVTTPGDINNNGQIVLSCSDITGNDVHGFLLSNASNGVFTPTDPPDAIGGEAGGINDQGQIIGNYGDSMGRQHGYLLSDGVHTTIDPPKSALTAAFGINNDGVIVGTFLEGSLKGKQRGFIRDQNGHYSTFDYPFGIGVLGTEPTQINDLGQILGFAIIGYDPYPPPQDRGFILDPMTGFKDFNFPGSPNTIPSGINNSGQIVGIYGESFDTEHGFFFENNTFTTIDYPNANDTQTNGINDLGQIVGAFRLSIGGGQTGFVAQFVAP